MVVQLRLPGLLSGITVACPESTNLILPLNVANYLDPTQRSDMELTVRKAAADIATTVTWLNSMQGGVLDIPTATTINTSIPIGGINIFDNSGAITNPFVGNPITIGGPNPINGNGNPGLISGSGGSGDISAPATSYQSKLSSRLSLIQEYCDKYGQTVDIEEIRSKYADNPEEGVAYCDEILNEKFDQTLLRKLVHKKYDEYNKTRQEEGKTVADNWVKTVLEAGLDSPQISAGVNTRNILEVVGAFAMNKEVKRGKVSMENVMESPDLTIQLIETMKSKMDKMLLDPEVDDSTKQEIADKIKEMRINYDKYKDSVTDDDRHNDIEFKQVRSKLAKTFMELFAIARLDEAKRTDEIAPQYYGLPDNSSITFDDRTKRAQEEINAYNNRRRFATTI